MPAADRTSGAIGLQFVARCTRILEDDLCLRSAWWIGPVEVMRQPVPCFGHKAGQSLRVLV